MSIDVLAADERGDENVQRWLASGLPVPPSWRISRQAVLEQDTDGLVRRLKAEIGHPVTVIATGGVASLFEGAAETIDHFDPDVTIRGLLEVWRRNARLEKATE